MSQTLTTAGLLLQYTFSDQTTEPPTSSQIRLNAAAPYTAVGHVFVRYTTDNGLDAFHLLHNVKAGDRLVLQDKNDHLLALTLDVVAPGAVDKGTHLDLAVVYRDATGAPFNNNQAVALVLVEVDVIETSPPPVTPAAPYATCACGPGGDVALLPNVNVLVVPPLLEPLTLDEAKLRAGLSWAPGDPRDAQMHLFIAAARQRVERDTGVALLTQTREVYLSHLVHPVDFPAPARPLQSVELITTPDAVYPWARRIVVGYPDVASIPPLLQFAVGLLTAHYATAARDVVVIGTIVQTVPLGYEDAIADYRRLAC